jgi:GTP cyclohydrolase II
MIEPYQHARTELITHFGAFDFHCFSWGTHEEDKILCLVKHPLPDVPLIRVQSACYTAEIFRSLDCDCHEQLERSLQLIRSAGGIFIYMICDGRGAGLLNKVKGLELGRTERLDTSDAYSRLNLDQDPREYSRVAKVLQYFSISSVRLLTNNPRKLAGLAQLGFDVKREPIEIPATDASRPYLLTKRDKMGHLLSQLAGNLANSNSF